MKYIKYALYIVRHKWFVFIECCKLGIPIRGIFHDWTKLLPDEFIPYAKYFYGPKIPHPTKKVFGDDDKRTPMMNPPIEVQEAFDMAWLKHQKRNSHHWQYWLLSHDRPRPRHTLQSFGAQEIYGSHVGFLEDGIEVAYVHIPDCDKIGWENPPEYAVSRLIEDLVNTPTALRMPFKCMKEMLADWHGAGKALGKPDTARWYKGNRNQIFLHPDVRFWIEEKMELLP